MPASGTVVMPIRSIFDVDLPAGFEENFVLICQKGPEVQLADINDSNGAFSALM